MSKLLYLELSGGPKEAGYALGRFGAQALHTQLLPQPVWQTLMQSKSSLPLTQILASIEQAYPLVWSALQGLAAGLELPLEDVVLWNARTQCLPAEQAPERCQFYYQAQSGLSLSYALTDPLGLDLPWAVAKCIPATGPAYASLLQPGVLPGSAFSVNQHGLVLAAEPGGGSQIAALPGFVLLRAMLEQVQASQIIEQIQDDGCAAKPLALSVAQRGLDQVWLVKSGTTQCLHAAQLQAPASPAAEQIQGAHVQAQIGQSTLDWQVYAAGQSSPAFVFRDITCTEAD